MAYIRPTKKVSSFVNVKGNHRAFYVVKADLHNRRITTITGRIGTVGRTKVYTFPTRDDARELLETIQERREMLGYVQVA